MRKFRIKEGVDTSYLYGHVVGGIYELETIDGVGDYWLKVNNKYKSWCYDPEELEEVFEDEEQKPILHKDTDLGHFASLLLSQMANHSNWHDSKETVKYAIDWAKELIIQLEKERKF